MTLFRLSSSTVRKCSFFLPFSLLLTALRTFSGLLTMTPSLSGQASSRRANSKAALIWLALAGPMPFTWVSSSTVLPAMLLRSP